ncbi:glioma pathogenesis-related protein 1 [Patella vulgata]|uniref:glioma pathogenesis-related protein 1 n=1 Tax=Patella vulgata TaxID=6465 RepID=UPI00217F7D89|nr:glioma pathogenesis-related protein 1 [Patella vulgata]
MAPWQPTPAFLTYILFFLLLMDECWSQGASGRRGANIRNFTEDDISEMLKLHNDYRRQAGATNMRKMVWNTDLQNLGQSFIDNCNYGHNPNTGDMFGFRHIGENLYLSSGDFYNLKPAVDFWHGEMADYNFTTGDCSNVCGHYTQVVWAGSHELGCGIIWCETLTGANTITQGTIIICNYGPSGNAGHEDPFEAGAACAACPADAPYCEDGLCSATDASGATTTPPAMDVTAPTTTTSTTMTTTATSSTNDQSTAELLPATTDGDNIITATDVTEIQKLDVMTQLVQNIVIFGFVSGALSLCLIFQYVNNYVNNKKEEREARQLKGV